MADERMTRAEIAAFDGYDAMDDGYQSLKAEALRLLDERDAAVALLDDLLCAGPPSQFEGNDCALCAEAACDDPEQHEDDCAYRRAHAFLATLAPTPSPGVG